MILLWMLVGYVLLGLVFVGTALVLEGCGRSKEVWWVLNGIERRFGASVAFLLTYVFLVFETLVLFGFGWGLGFLFWGWS